MYEDGTPGEIFIVMSKEGSTISGVMDAFATAVSLALQYGVPLKVLVDKFTHTRFEPSGFTNNKQIPIAKSVMDYIFRWLALKFLPEESGDHNSITESPSVIEKVEDTEIKLTDSEKPSTIEQTEKSVFVTQADSPPCPECGSIMVRSGSCYKCFECGATSGCS
jgi:ribonucleoside-diphosphate reductase alpha chain